MKTVKEALEDEGASGEWLKKVTEDISFQVFEVIDAGCEMKCGDDYLLPFLAFRDESEGADSVVINDAGSCLHEVMFFASDNLFSSEDNQHD